MASTVTKQSQQIAALEAAVAVLDVKVTDVSKQIDSIELQIAATDQRVKDLENMLLEPDMPSS